VTIQKETSAEIVNDDVVIGRDDPLTKVPLKSLVFATGYESNVTVLDQVKACGLPYLVIGDAKATRRLKDAIAEGHMAGTLWADNL
jgi:hypothetical protein